MGKYFQKKTDKIKMKNLVILVCLSISSAYSEDNFCAKNGDNHYSYLEKILSKIDPSEEKKDTYFYAESSSLADLQKLRNCVHYASCSKSSESIAWGSTSFRFHYSIKLSQDEIKKILTKCPRSELPKVIKILDKSSSPEVDLTLGWKNNSDEVKEYYKERQNTYLKNLSAEDYKKLFSSLDEKITKLDYDGAIAEIISVYGLSTFDYKVKADNSIQRNIGKTDHIKKEVLLGKDILLDSKMIVLVIRHELEHVQQVKHLDKCEFKKETHGFSNHNYRERCAYMNDLINIRNLCQEDKKCIERFSLESMTQSERYIGENKE